MLFCFYLLVLALVVSISSGSLSVPPANKSTKLPAQNMDTSIRSETDGKRMPRVTDVSNQSVLEERQPEADAIVGTVKAYLKQLLQSMRVKGPPSQALQEETLAAKARSIPTQEAMSLLDPMHPNPDEKFQQAWRLASANAAHLDLTRAGVTTRMYALVLKTEAGRKKGHMYEEAMKKAKAYRNFRSSYDLAQVRATIASFKEHVEENQAPHLPPL
uniref:RxLR effector protein n=1 Tax=Peronospora matthiolae TaxID=2874970 RepID=A0AAV1URH2_9STRA